MRWIPRRFPAQPPATGPGRLARSSRRLALGVLAAAVVLALSAPVGLRDQYGGLLGPRAASAAAQPAPLAPTELVALPANRIANATKPIVITLSAPPSPTSPTPTLHPSVAGTWAIEGDSEVFTPASTLQPCSTYKLTVWADTTSTGHARLGRRRTVGLNVACPPVAGLQQALARLGHLGARFHPLYTFHEPAGPETRHEAAVHAYHPPRGRFAPDPPDAPPVEAGKLDQTTRGALTVYQSDRGLAVTGEPDRQTWASLLSEVAADRRDPHPYTWVTVSESLPETLEVHRGHHVVLSSATNTGVPGAETPQGIFPIFARFVSTTMSGEDPDGTKYVVPDVPWVNYFNGGDAVHGYPRASYGFPQSNGCVELPIETAQVVFGMLQIGDIVEVT
ncbi:MAG TPA: L,D-transpeptidase family protein [Solirubrobacteraceae bacterium]|nr:L,D-transpeptidase family protein [Solirubrobacteraceae bacterium]